MEKGRLHTFCHQSYVYKVTYIVVTYRIKLYDSIGTSRFVTSMLVMNVGDEMCWGILIIKYTYNQTSIV